MRISGKILAGIGLLSCLLAAVVIVGYSSIFSTFLWYDDEGYVMISLQGFLEGNALYDDVFSNYGPFYYFQRAGVFKAFDLPLSHDVNRLMALSEWLAASTLGSVLAFRVTRSWVAALLGGGLLFLHLEVLTKEPGHPQGLALVLTLAVACLATFVGDFTVGNRPLVRRQRILVIAMGVLTGAAAMTKINVGALVALPVFFSLLLQSLKTRKPTRVGSALVVGATSVPFVLMAPGLGSMSHFAYAATIGCSILAAVIVARRNAVESRSGIRLALLLAVSAMATALLILLATHFHGTSWSGLVDGLWSGPRRFAERSAAAPLPFSVGGAVFGVASVALAVTYLYQARLRRAQPTAWSRWLQLFFGISIVAVVLGENLYSSQGLLASGAGTRGLAPQLLAYWMPFVWLGLLPSSSAQSGFGMTTLCVLAVFQSLVAYPVFGTQVALSTVLLIVTGIVCLHRAGAALVTSQKSSQVLRYGVGGTLLGLLCVVLIAKGVYTTSEYWRREALDLPGAHRLRLGPGRTEVYRGLAGALRRHADTFVSVHGFNSLYFWAEIPPPTHYNATLWYWMLSPEQQTAVIESLARYPRACMIYNSRTNLRPASQYRDVGILAEHLFSEFHPVAKCEEFLFCIREGRDRPEFQKPWRSLRLREASSR